MPAVSPRHPIALLESFSPDPSARSFRFEGLLSTIVAFTPDEVSPALARVEREVADGRHAAGYVAYEAAPGLNPHLAVGQPAGLPLVWFGIFAERHSISSGEYSGESGPCQVSSPELDIDHDRYTADVAAIREAIAAGDTYQVNFTTRQRFTVSGDAFTLYRRMCRNQRAPFCAWLDIGSHRILSASPELFFSLRDNLLTMKPMKGTAPRGPGFDEDRRRREQLAASQKDRAENLMIVDLVRNDLAMIAETGSVAVPALFEVETYPTVHQMTSTVTARIRPEAGLIDILRALFPCGSVTGAPKRRTMEIIRDLEETSRGVYCGAIGYLSPGREAVFSVAIRTAVVEAATGTGEIGIGSGITWDSDAEAEWRECLTKSAFMFRDSGEFQLIESLRHDDDGYLLLDRHLQRLAQSAAYLGYRFEEEPLRRRLSELGLELSGVNKVRILLDQNGNTTVESQAIDDLGQAAPPAPIALAGQRVNARDPFLYHKTTRRAIFDSARQEHPDCYDVILLNQQDQLTEGSFNTLVISQGGELLTPALECGLLPGVLRAELLAVGAIREAVLTAEDLKRAERIWLLNSVRGWRECKLKD
ncbi:aminodeoxychorismate synthase component I [Geobacter sp. SVR]|uniref:aminodeoxychorismate synthase component I n=1 Tax=Geobacter sp. SVR TaxID=2495594 RepID=UPI00143EFD55|nr:aminodeoxychorismate synthase component I [Geobacter sp. SVR]BCS55224.1 aminodeoxychorismate synthase, component I [Geobacter sp. SVR]GCF86023.1 aminodeoxychorismate synthase, component I [Geobacter sp. SVR]